jgi:cellulose synthase/poly-beta-1,6-N-acetylglucosamine synthase-like glycosyltransferase
VSIVSSPSVSVVIPAYNEQASIEACVLAVIAQTVPAIEIIVVDNRSSDATVAIVERLQAAHPDAGIRLLHQDDEQGLVPTRNVGLDAAVGDVLGRIDADTILEPRWIANVAAAFDDPEVGGATGPVLYYDLPFQEALRRTDDALRRTLGRISPDVRLLFGSNMALRASAWREIRGEVCRDVADDFHEDIDLSIHLQEHGFGIVYSSEIVAGMSARRLDDKPRDYVSYVMRFERTYQAHGIRSVALRTPMLVFLAAYPALRVARRTQARRLAADAAAASSAEPAA